MKIRHPSEPADRLPADRFGMPSGSGYNPTMRKLRHLAARLTLFVFLATVFSPSFGWDMVSGEMDHDHIVLYVADVDHTDHGPAHPGEAPDSHHGEHDRAGHVLGHMPATIGVLDYVAPTPAGRCWFPADLPIVLPDIPEDFLRPPNGHALA